MFPVPSRCVMPNPVFLDGLGTTPNATDLVAQDAAVSSLQAQMQTAKMTVENIGNQMVTVQTSGGYDPKNHRYETMSVKDYATSRWRRNKIGQVQKYGKPFHDPQAFAATQPEQMVKAWESAKQNVKSIESRLKAAEESAWARLTKDLPYKSAIIKPRKSGDSIIYTVQEYTTGKTIGTGKSMEEAKALVDNKIAAEQEREVQQWQKQRTADAAQAAAQQSSGGGSTVGPDGTPKKSGKGKLLLGAGAAAAALMLLR